MGDNQWGTPLLATCVDEESVLDGEGFYLVHVPLYDPNAFVTGQLGRESSLGEYYFTMRYGC